LLAYRAFRRASANENGRAVRARPIASLFIQEQRLGETYLVAVLDVPVPVEFVPLVLVPLGPVSFFLSQPTLNKPMLQIMSNAQIFFITTPFLNVVDETRFAGPSCTLSTT
jgi:hypothetical protein